MAGYKFAKSMHVIWYVEEVFFKVSFILPDRIVKIKMD